MDEREIAQAVGAMDGCLIELGAMVAAGALISPGKQVNSGELWAGTLAKPIRRLTDEDRAALAKLAPRYVSLAGEYLAADRLRPETRNG